MVPVLSEKRADVYPAVSIESGFLTRIFSLSNLCEFIPATIASIIGSPSGTAIITIVTE